jgi:transcriptional regulatory protein AMDR
MLHLTYNNFLILLHRPHPKASAYSEDYGPHDAEICSAAAGVITSIIEELRQQNGIRYLWCSGVFTVFTAMIQVRVELRFSNPVLAINALRRFDSTLHSLRELADYWSSAETILRLFENSKRLQQDLRVVHNEVTEKFEEPRKQTEPRQQTTPTTTTNSVSRAEIPPPPPSMNSQSIISAAGHHQPLNSMPATVSAANLARPGSNDVWPSEPPPASRLDSDTFARANDISSVQQVVAGMDTPREYLDWRQLFPFTDPANPGPMSIEAFPDMEDEWRQLYWEPQMTDLFQEGIWLQ